MISRKRFIKTQISGIVRQIEKTGKMGAALEMVAELDFWWGEYHKCYAARRVDWSMVK